MFHKSTNQVWLWRSSSAPISHKEFKRSVGKNGKKKMRWSSSKKFHQQAKNLVTGRLTCQINALCSLSSVTLYKGLLRSCSARLEAACSGLKTWPLVLTFSVILPRARFSKVALGWGCFSLILNSLLKLNIATWFSTLNRLLIPEQNSRCLPFEVGAPREASISRCGWWHGCIHFVEIHEDEHLWLVHFSAHRSYFNKQFAYEKKVQ